MNQNYVYHSQSDVGKVRKANEDAFGDAITDNGHVFVVCDGMGGHIGGAKASQLAVSSILEYFENHTAKDPKKLIAAAIKFANTQVHGHATAYPEFDGMGTTCVVLLISPQNEIYYGHVGDSRIYQFVNGQLQQLTKDHSYVQYLVDTGEITEEEMETHPKKNQILKALGIDEEVKPGICEQAVHPQNESLFLLCTDGLNGMISDAKISTILQDFPSQKTNKTVEILIQEALNQGGKDNVTATLLYFENSDTEIISAVGTSQQTASNAKQRYLWIGIPLVLITILFLVLGMNNWGEKEKAVEENPPITDSLNKHTEIVDTITKDSSLKIAPSAQDSSQKSDQ